MRNNFNFLSLTENIKGIITLPTEFKEKKYPFIIVNTDNDRGLYVRKLELELTKYKGLQQAGRSDSGFHGIKTNDLIVFGDSLKYDYRIEMNYVTLVPIAGRRKVRVFDLVDDFDRITKRLATYCKNNGIRVRNAYRDDVQVNLNITVVDTEKPRKVSECPLLRRFQKETKKTLVSVYDRPNLTAEKITVHANWVKIGWNQYDIYVDTWGGKEFIVLEDGEKLFVKEDRYGRRYLDVS